MQLKKYKFCKDNIINKKNYTYIISSNKKKEFILSTLKFIIFNIDYTSGKLGIIIPKKNLKLSCNRNVYKRIIREMFRHNKNIFLCKAIIVILIKKINKIKKINIWKSLHDFLTLYKKS